MCRISKHNGVLQTSCGSVGQKSVLRVKSAPFVVSEEPMMKESINEKGDEIVSSLLRRIQMCYEGKLKKGKCVDPIDLVLIKSQTCSACHKHIPEIKARVSLMKSYGIPVSLNIYDVKDTQGNLFAKEMGCQGLPCVGMRDIQNPSKFRKINEGIDKPISFFSKIMEEPNPLIYNVNPYIAPRGLIRKRRR